MPRWQPSEYGSPDRKQTQLPVFVRSLEHTVASSMHPGNALGTIERKTPRRVRWSLQSGLLCEHRNPVPATIIEDQASA